MLRNWLSELHSRFASHRLHRSLRKRSSRRRVCCDFSTVITVLEDRTLLSVTILNGDGSGYAGNSGGGPPDEAGAAGPNIYLETSNGNLAIYGSKDAGAPVVTDTPLNFFFTTGGLARIDATSQRIADVTMVYHDSMGGTGRFVIGNIDINKTTNVSQFVFAVSTSNNPMTFTAADWNFYAVATTQGPAGNTTWTDYPGNPGYNADALVVSFNMAQGNSLTGNAQIVSFDANDLAAGNPLVTTGPGQNVFRNSITGSFNFRPATMHDSVAGDPMWFVQDVGNGTQVNVVRMDNVLSTTGAATNPTTFTTTTLNLPVANTYDSSGFNNPLNPDSTQMNDVPRRILKAAEYNDVVVASQTVPVGNSSIVSATVRVNNMGVALGGAGYVVGDVLTVSGAAVTAAMLRVDTIGAGGSVTGVTVTNAGNYMSLAGVNGSVTGGSGAGAVFNFVYSGELDVQWYAFDVSGVAPDFQMVGGSPNVGRIGYGANTYSYEAGIDINSLGQIGLSFMQSDTIGGAADPATGGSPSTFVATRMPTDPAGTLDTPILVPAGTGAGNIGAGGTRIGDFSGLAIDPTDGTFWAVNQYASGGGGPTVIANFAPALDLSPTEENITIRVNPLDSDMIQVLVTGTSTLVTTFPNNSPNLYSFVGNDKNNTVTIDERFGIVNTPIFFDGGGSPGAPGDRMIVIGTSGDDTLEVNPTSASSADMTFDGSRTYSFRNIRQFSFNGEAGNDTMTVDSGASLLGLPGGILYDGGSGFNNLNLIQTDGPTRSTDVYTVGPNPGQGTSTITGGATSQTVFFQNLAPVLDLVPATTLTVNATAANNAVNYSVGSTVTTGLVRVDEFEPIEFSNKSTLILNGRAGSDEINLNNSLTPTGLTSITVNGGDPTASDLLIANGTTGVNAITFTPTGADTGSIGGAGPVPINFLMTEHVTINGRGGADTLRYQSPSGGSLLNFIPGATVNSGLVTGRRFSGQGGEVLVPMDYVNIDHSRSLAQVIFANTGGHVDDLVFNGSTGTDVFTVLPNSGNGSVLVENGGGIPDALTHTVDTRGIRAISLKGQGGNDTFNLTGTLPYTRTVIDADATVNLDGAAAGTIVVNLADNTPNSTTPNSTISGYGGLVVLSGVAIANLDADNSTALTVNGTSRKDNIVYSPSGAEAGSFQNVLAPGGETPQNTVFNFTDEAGTFTINGLADVDRVTLVGTDDRDLITINASARTAVLQNAAGTNLKQVRLGTDVEALSAQGLLANDTFVVIPAAAGGAELLVDVDGGLPGASDTLIVGSDADGSALAATDFAVVAPGLNSGEGRIRVFRNAGGGPSALPDISYSGVEIVFANVADDDDGNPQRLVFGPDPYEPNDARTNASHIGAGHALNGDNLSIFSATTENFPTSLPLADADWFQFVAEETGVLDFQIYFELYDAGMLPGGGDLNIEILDSDGDLIAAGATLFDSNAIAIGKRTSVPVVRNQTYYLRVYGAPQDMGAPAAVNGYEMTVINVPAPVPQTVDLQAASDSGRSDTDDITNVVLSTYDIVLDDDRLDEFMNLDLLPDTTNDDAQTDGFDYGVEVFNNGVSIGYAYYTGVGNTWQFSATAGDLNEGHNNFLTAAVWVRDRAMPNVVGTSDQQGPINALQVTLDTIAPTGTVNLHPDSDTGVWGFPETMMDGLTTDKVPLLYGATEANALVRVALDIADNPPDGIPDGTAVALPYDGDEAFPPPPEFDGNYFLQTILNLSDGAHTLTAFFQDVAGNESPADDSPELTIFIDTEGPKITNVTRGVVSTDNVFSFDGETSLFEPKPSPTGPDPLVHSIVIHFSDLPDRTEDFDYDALLAALAEEEGNYSLKGDHNGYIAITSVNVTFHTTPEDGLAETAEVELVFDQPLPDDRYTLWVSDSITDPAGNPLDGESGALGPFEGNDVPDETPPIFPTGDGAHGGDFHARFTIDSRPEIGTYALGTSYIDINGNFVFDPDGKDRDYTNRDIVFLFGNRDDAVFAGNFADALEDSASGYDKLGSYGVRDGKGGPAWHWRLDFNHDGVIDFEMTSGVQVSGSPVAGDFDPDHPGDEIGLFNGGTWYLDTNGNNNIGDADDTQLRGNLRGLPVVGDFDGDGLDDLATWTPGNEGLQTKGRFSIDLAYNGLTGDAEQVIEFDLAGVFEQPVAADMNQDGIDDLGLFVTRREGVTPEESAEWFFLISDDSPRTPGQVTALNHPYTPVPFGTDIFAQFGDEQAAPLVGNFDPPTTQFGEIQAGVIGADAGSSPRVRVFDNETGEVHLDFLAYNPNFLGGVRVASGDVNGDGVADVITGAGAGGGPHVRVFSGVDGSELMSFFAYDPRFTGGVMVASGDVNHDGFADVVVGAGTGGGPHVRVISGLDGAELASFMAFNPAFRGGVTVASGDVNRDGFADVVVGAGAGGGPHVRVISGLDRTTELMSFFAYDAGFLGGVTVAVGDTDGDGFADIVTGPGAGGGPHVRVFSGLTGTELLGLMAFDPGYTGGVRVAAGDVGLDGDVDILVGPGTSPIVRAITGTGEEIGSYYTRLMGGAFVAGGQMPVETQLLNELDGIFSSGSLFESLDLDQL